MDAFPSLTNDAKFILGFGLRKRSGSETLKAPLTPP